MFSPFSRSVIRNQKLPSGGVMTFVKLFFFIWSIDISISHLPFHFEIKLLLQIEMIFKAFKLKLMFELKFLRPESRTNIMANTY